MDDTENSVIQALLNIRQAREVNQDCVRFKGGSRVAYNQVAVTYRLEVEVKK